jgi:hypothetical protein
VKEGELTKISRKGAATRYFVLLSDCLLYTTYQGAWAGDSTNLKVGTQWGLFFATKTQTCLFIFATAKFCSEKFIDFPSVFLVLLHCKDIVNG